MARKTREKPPVVYGYRVVYLSIFLALAGVVIILSSTSISSKVEHLSSYTLAIKHAVRVIVGLLILWLASHFDYHYLHKVSSLFLLVSIVFLVICILPQTTSLAPEIGGARRWIHLKFISFQPSELAKFFLILWAADYLVRKKDLVKRFIRGFLPFILIVGAVSLLVLKQPDLSMACIILLLALLIGYLGRLKLSHLIFLTLLILPFFTYRYVIKVNYRHERLVSFLEGEEDKSGHGYQAYQSKLALGSGGICGVGPGNSKQKYFFLPAAHTDFIFAILGEEMGFAGTTLVIALFCYLAFMGVKIAGGASDDYGFLLSSGLTLMIFISALLHMAVVSGLTPTTGMPLPFFSYGGTNLVTSFWAVGILNNISRQRQVQANG